MFPLIYPYGNSAQPYQLWMQQLSTGSTAPNGSLPTGKWNPTPPGNWGGWGFEQGTAVRPGADGAFTAGGPVSTPPASAGNADPAVAPSAQYGSIQDEMDAYRQRMQSIAIPSTTAVSNMNPYPTPNNLRQVN